ALGLAIIFGVLGVVNFAHGAFYMLGAVTTAVLLDALDRHGPLCGTPGAVSTPGLLSGMAGIGYSLLRLGLPDRVPSVLLLQPGFHRENNS
ncbi:ABC transporter permease subunit, partial [Actinokineospora sp.]|uniref:ABC transporter permease subunit n=1 Tax=Actinokineospora sp. TaxID=1872133 RepID=UPI003D6B7181